MLELDQRVARKLIEGRESAIPALAEKDRVFQEGINEQECPQCGDRLRARIPADPARVFNGLSISYERVCPTHGAIGG